MAKRKDIIEDGFNSELVETALFDGILEIPCIEKPSKLIIPEAVIPFSERKKTKDFSEFIVFYEYDEKFGDILSFPNSYLAEIKQFEGMVSLDCSLYRDMPLTAQIANTYRNRSIGYFFQKHGIYVIPNVRWGDERSYTTSTLPEKFAFLGIPKHSIVSVGTYGAMLGKENRKYFRQGLEAMIKELEPEVVLVYGCMPNDVFGDFMDKTQFVHFVDWTSSRRRRGK